MRQLPVGAAQIVARFNDFDHNRRVIGFRCGLVICADWGSQQVQRDLDESRCEVVFLGTAGGGKRENMVPLASLNTKKGIEAYVERMKRVAVPFDAISYCLRKRRA